MSSAEMSRIGWYARRARRMSLAELLWRSRDKAVQTLWMRHRVSHDQLAMSVSCPQGDRRFTAVLPPDTAARVPDAARKSVLAAADELMAGRWEVLGVVRRDMQLPDWFSDPATGRQAPADCYAFRINHRTGSDAGHVKHLWELSRLQHVTLLSTAWFLSRDDAYARRVADHLQSWWEQNPFLTGVHWASGIEVGIRLISLAWIRRLLDSWPGVGELFERNDLAVQQILWHQQYLALFRSRGSAADNHVIGEAAGQLIASCAFPWFEDSGEWRQASARLLERELLRNTFPSGIGREQASDYQCFVAELGVLAAVEAATAGIPIEERVRRRLCAMLDSSAALLDEQLRPPRQGDGGQGRALLLDAPADNRWPSLLALGEAVCGRLDWWPRTAPGATSVIVGAMPAIVREPADRPAQRPWHFKDAGVTLLRTTSKDVPEIWCRCDGGPHGFPTIAAHAHADALSVEVRHGGVDVLADPGTYSYHGKSAWRAYFRSTIGHNTLELDGRNQSTEGGPFLWLRHANGRLLDVRDIGDAVEWTAEHDGYCKLDPPAWHRRCVRLDRASRAIDIVDEIPTGGHSLRLAFHLGPDVAAELYGATAYLSWPGTCLPGAARMELPGSLRWTLHRGEENPISGWYSRSLGQRVPATTLIGVGQSVAAQPLVTRLEFSDTVQPRWLTPGEIRALSVTNVQDLDPKP
jgi:Heparinase II/III-like protein/Heparinase II/III N-terminus